VDWHLDESARVFFPVSLQIVSLVRLELKKIKSFYDDNTIALQEGCSEKM